MNDEAQTPDALKQLRKETRAANALARKEAQAAEWLRQEAEEKERAQKFFNEYPSRLNELYLDFDELFRNEFRVADKLTYFRDEDGVHLRVDGDHRLLAVKSFENFDYLEEFYRLGQLENFLENEKNLQAAARRDAEELATAKRKAKEALTDREYQLLGLR